MSTAKSSANESSPYFVFYLVGSLLAIASATGITLMLMFANEFNDSKTIHVVIGLIGAMLLLVVAVVILVYPTYLEKQIVALTDFPSAIKEVQKQMNDLEAVRREHFKQRQVLESTEKVLQAAHEELVKFFEAMQKVLIDRKQIDEERTQARQKASEFQKQMDAWVEAVVAFLKVLERNFDAQSGTTPEHRKALEYVLNTFLRTISPLGFSVIRPEADQDFVGTIHHADGEELSPTIKPGHVIRGVSWGYSFNGRVVERAHVIVAKQEKKPEPAPAPTPTPPEPSKDGKKDEPAQDQKKDEKPKEERKDTPQPMPAAKPEDKKAPETKPNSAPAPQGKK